MEHLVTIAAPPVTPTVTIWIHGTKGAARRIPLSLVHSFFEYPFGISAWHTLDHHLHHYKIGHTLTCEGPELFIPEHFYFFGWSGILSFQAREQAAQELFAELKKLGDVYRERYGNMPHIRLITHSHGGNVVLNLVPLVEQAGFPFTIDELILLACPVQQATEQYITSPLFKSIYVLYSTMDMFQVLDMQGLYESQKGAPLFSKRCFAPQDNLIHIKVMSKHRRPLAHVEFLLPPFLQEMPLILARAADLQGKVAVWSYTLSQEHRTT